MGCNDVERNIDCLLLICCGILGVLKTTWFRINANNLIINFNSAINDYQTINNIKERDIMKKHAFIGRILCFSLLTIAYCSSLTYSLIPSLNCDKGNQINITNEDIMEYNRPYRDLESLNLPTYIYIIFSVIETIVLILATTANLGNSSLFFTNILCLIEYYLATKNFLMKRILFYMYNDFY